jgi:O-antigen biosynthesis alpha-1,3-mannosyltransferase
MKVAFDASAILGKSGIEVAARDLVQALAALDVDLHMILVGRRRHRDALRALVGSKHDVRDVMPHDLMLGPSLTWLTHALQRRTWYRATSDADLIHFTGLTSWRPRVDRAVVTVHDLFPLMRDMGSPAHLQRSFPSRIEPMLQGALRVIVPSAYVASTIERFYPQHAAKVRVVHHGPGEQFRPMPMDDAAWVRLGIAADRPYLLFVGRVDPRKNLSRMLDAWMRLPTDLRAGNRFVLVLSGLPDDIATFKARESQALGDPSIVTLFGPSTPDVIRLYSSARGLAFASLAEGFGLPIIEAMRCGCPVLTSSTSSLGEVAGDAAMLVDPHSVEDIQAAMQRMLTDDDLHRDLRARGLRRGAEFTFDAAARKTYDVYREAVDA